MTRNPFDELEQMLDRMSKQFEEGVATPGMGGSVPVDVRDEGDQFRVLADLPGYEAEDLELTLSDRRLDLQADREEHLDVGDEDGSFVRRERRRSSVSRSVTLPEEVDEEGVSASLDDGVLTVTLPKRHDDDGKEIEIEE